MHQDERRPLSAANIPAGWLRSPEFEHDVYCVAMIIDSKVKRFHNTIHKAVITLLPLKHRSVCNTEMILDTGQHPYLGAIVNQAYAGATSRRSEAIIFPTGHLGFCYESCIRLCVAYQLDSIDTLDALYLYPRRPVPGVRLAALNASIGVPHLTTNHDIIVPQLPAFSEVIQRSDRCREHGLASHHSSIEFSDGEQSWSP
jgi:hypothetical protein